MCHLANATAAIEVAEHALHDLHLPLDRQAIHEVWLVLKSHCVIPCPIDADIPLLNERFADLRERCVLALDRAAMELALAAGNDRLATEVRTSAAQSVSIVDATWKALEPAHAVAVER